MKLNSESLKNTRFTVHRGKYYDAREVDAFLDELIAAVEAAEETPDRADPFYVQQLEAVCEIRAEMTELITKEILRAEKLLAPYTASDK